MIAPWMGYVLVISALLALVAGMAEQVAVVQGWTRRWIWAGAVVASLALVALSPRRGVVTPVMPALQLEKGAVIGANEAITPALRQERQTQVERQPIVRWGALGEVLDKPLWVLWIGASAALLLVTLYGALSLALRRRQWREQTVDGVRILVAAADGPAVVGLVRPRVVIPEWSLELDDTSRGMMLRHEQEHVRARDPLLVQFAGLAVLALPWNLPVWWMLRRLRLAVEVDCDARVLAHTARPAVEPPPEARAYGELLLKVATRHSRHLMAAPALLEHTTALGRRIMAMNPRFPRFPRVHSTLFAAGAITVAALAGFRQPPSLERRHIVGDGAGWVLAWQREAEPPMLLGALRERLGERFPGLRNAAGPSVVALGVAPDGHVVASFGGAQTRGPLMERVVFGYGHAIELLLSADSPAAWRAADQALFGEIPAGDGVRAYARAPVREGVNGTAMDVVRLPAGEAGPGVVYAFVMTLRERP